MSDKLIIKGSKTYSGFKLDISESFSLDGITAIFGPSGAGKSSLLKIIAGIERLDNGEIIFKGDTWFDKSVNTPAHKREAGYLFQSGSLFSHLNVQKNLRFADKRSRHIENSMTLDNVIQALNLQPLLDRKILTLSGGEQRRAALGRLLLSRPKILLLDEPLTGLDRNRKREALSLIKSITKTFSLPCLYISHDIEEVTALADYVMIIKHGTTQAHGPATQILNLIDTLPLTDLDIEPGAVFETTVQEIDGDTMKLQIGKSILLLPSQTDIRQDQILRLKIRSQDVSIATQKPRNISIQNCLRGQIKDIIAVKGTVFFDVVIALENAAETAPRLKSRITRRAKDGLGLSMGLDIYALIKTASLQKQN